jgi:SAM-dependent methyltransferase
VYEEKAGIQGKYMEKDAYDFLETGQENHWWIKSKCKIVDSFLKSTIRERNLSIIDIGSGFGAVIPALKKWGYVDAVESYERAHPVLQKLGVKKIIDIPDFPETIPEGKYDLVCLADVLEHIKDDFYAAQVIHDRMLSDRGRIILTVPAYQWLWTSHDLIHHHCRRYNHRRLELVLKRAGFKNIRISYFMTLLFPLAIVQRVVLKFFPSKTLDDTPPHPFINTLFSTIFGIESILLRKINLPFGLSLIAIAEKSE